MDYYLFMECNHERGKTKHHFVTCPVCNKKIELYNILELKSRIENAANYPVPVSLMHGMKPNRHVLTLYIDKQFKIRGREVSEMVLVSR